MAHRTGLLIAALVAGGMFCAAGRAASGPPTLPDKAIPNSVASFQCPRNPTHRSTIDIEACLGRELLKLGRDFNSQVVVLWSILDPVGRRAFLRAQGAWLTYRDQACTARARAFVGGTLAPVTFGQCEVELTSARLKEVRSTLTYFCRGRVRTGLYRRCPRS